ncbi:MAG TPA: transposase [Actinobacteria bacterium]|nr:transposase [Actinomycetota bacterium]
MPRQPRLEAEGLLYHIIARGIESSKIFRDKTDYSFFLNRFGKILTDTQTDCLAFALLPNHFHLLLRSNKVSISTVMRRLLTSYAVVFNKRHKRSGHLFQNRYKSIICQEEPYLLELIRYIHLNPIRAEVVPGMDDLSSYPYSSHYALLRKIKLPWYTPEIVLDQFGNNYQTAQRKYLNFLKEGLSFDRESKYEGGGLKRSLGIPNVYPTESQAFDDRVLGDSGFVLALQAHEENTRSRREDVGMEDLIKVVADFYSFSTEQIQGNSIKEGLNKARAVAAYLASSKLGLSFAEIARDLNVHRANAARMVNRGKTVPLNDQIKMRLNI